MKQKIVVRVCMCCDKCRSKAMAVAAATGGVVDSVALEGKYRDEVVVVGEGVDSVKLTKALGKVGVALLLQVAEVKKPPPPPPPPPPPQQQTVTFFCHHCHPCYGYYSCYCYCHRH